MFNKKRKEEKIEEKEVSYIEWEKDFGFLEKLITRKKSVTENFLINIENSQRNEKDYLKDEDIVPIVEESVFSLISSIGAKYKNFLIEKYFGDLENFVKYLTEEFYIAYAIDTINKNTSKIKMSLQKSNLKILEKINSRTKK
jgi:hypothetical protein